MGPSAYLKVIYDDRERYPWILMYADKVWARYGSREKALAHLERLGDVIVTVNRRYMEDRNL